MKKFQRLTLTVISVISIALFLTYRHQYNRLRHVLEVFNFFGTPCNISELERTEEVRVEYDWGPLSVWQEVDSKWYIYNAFLANKNKIQGIMIRGANKALPKTCLLMYEGEGKYKSAKFYAEKFLEDRQSNMVAFIYHCNLSSVKEPYMLAFKAQNQPRFSSVLITKTVESKISLNATICAVVNTFSTKALLEFLSFHNILGINSFIIYFEQNIPYNLIKLLKNFVSALNIWITFIPWNLPSSIPDNFSTALLGKDCQYRTRAHAKYALLLHLNEYVLPSSELYSKTTPNLPVRKFCLNHVNKNRPIVLQNFESVDNYSYNEVRKLYVSDRTVDGILNLSSIFDKNCVIHKYEKCSKGIKTKSDLSMKLYSTDLTRSTLVQLLINDSI